MFLSCSGILRYGFAICGLAALPTAFFLNDVLRYRMFKGGKVPSLDALANDPSTALESVHGSGRFDAWSNVLETFSCLTHSLALGREPHNITFTRIHS